MPRGGGGEHGYTEQDHPPATGHRGRDEDAPSQSPPPFLSVLPVIPVSFEKQQKQEQQPAASLPDDVLVEILSRVPYRSLCRFKCVSRPWLAICSDPDVRKRSPQTLSGFFCYDGFDLYFRNLSGRGPPLVDASLPFSRSYEFFFVVQCRSGLLLCKCWKSYTKGDEHDYVVCNPATGKWTVLPPMELPDQGVFYAPDHFLGFDPAVPSRFVVFAPLSNFYGEFTEVAIYSSETGRWTSMQNEWGSEAVVVGGSECVFLNGTMHLTTHNSSLVTVDMEGKAWREIEMPHIMRSAFDYGFIGQSQGRLYAWHMDKPSDNDCQLSVWVLEDYGSGQWTLKHTVNVLKLFGRHCRKTEESYKLFAIHPDCNLIFLTDGVAKTVSYDMDNRKVHVICSSEKHFMDPGLPYIPCFAEWLSDGH